MNILNVTAYDNMGQQFGGYQLHMGLKALGHDSHLAVMQAAFDDPGIHTVGNSFTRRLDYRRLPELEDRHGVQQLLTLSGSTLHFAPYFKSADVVHLQLMHSGRFFSLLNVPLMSRRRPTVWSLHDPWMMSGHCVYPMGCERWMTGCGSCPDLTLPLAVERDRTAFMWKVKRWVMRHSRLTLVVASQWMRERVRRSPILSHLPCEVIPYGIETATFAPRDRAAARARFGIAEEAHVLAFRFPNSKNNYKGGEWLEKALLALELKRPTHLIAFDGVLPDSLRGKYTVTETGWTDDQHLMADALGAADVFLMPSVAEAFGMMAVEAMACGTPVIVFEGTSLPGVIHAPRGGIAVPYKDSEALARATEKVLNDRGLAEGLSREGLRIVREEYTMQLYVGNHVRLYESLLGESRGAPA